MDLELNTEFLSSPLVMWIRTFTVAAFADLTELADGHLLNKIMTEIDPTFFGMSLVYSNVCGDVSLRVHNLELLFKGMKDYYQKRLQQMIVMDLPDIFIIANDPECEESIQELGKILLLILGCAVQCERKEYFIEKITSLDETIQQELVLHIKEITEKCDKAFTFQPNEIADLSHEELLSFCEDMYDQMLKIIDQRDYHAEELHRLLLDKFYPTKEVNGNIQRVNSPPVSPRNSEIVLAEKNKVRQLTEELEEKHLMIQELKEELELNKSLTQKLIQENKTLMEKTRLFNEYRDQMDVLHIQAERASKLEGDITKYKEKLLEMEGLKKRIEELEEQNDILYSTKKVLQKQVTTLTSKAERLGQTEGEIAKLKANIKALTEEKRILESRHENALEENAKLLLEAQNSFSEVSHLSSALNMVKEKEETGTCLATEYNQISSTKLLRLEHENHRLKVLIGELTQYKVAGAPQEVVEENDVENGTCERTTENVLVTTENHQVGSVESLASVKKTLHNKETELTAAQEHLKKKEEFANIVAESLSAKEQENSELQDRIQQLMNQKKRTDQLIHRKDEDVAELERRLDEVISERQKSEEIVRKKTRELNELNSSLSELNEDKMRTVETAKKKAKDITELKERIEIILLEKEKFVDNCSAKDKELINLENRLQRVQEANQDLAETLESKREKISNQENRMNELVVSAKEEERRYNETTREKDRRLKEFERKIGDLIEMENELERLNSQIKQKDRKSDGFLKTIEQKDQEIVVLENRLEDAKSNNNKVLYNLEQKENKIGSLEQRLMKAETKAEKQESNEDEESRKLLESRDDKILELESRLEDVLNSSKKLQHTLKVKDEKIVTLETRLEEGQVVELERNKLAKSFEEKKKRIAVLESSLDDVSGESQKQSCDLQLKENKVKDLEERVRVLESENKESEKMKNVMEEKDDKVFSLSQRIQGLLEQIAVIENRFEETNSQNKKLVHVLKIKDDRIASLEESVLDVEELTNKNQKLKQVAQQKEDKLRAMDEKMDEYEEATRKCERLTQKVADREERIRKLNERLTELETHGLNNEKLKQTIAQKDDRIKILEVSLDDIQLKYTTMETELTKIEYKYEEKVKRSLEDVDTHKVRRQESVRRREEQIKSLEQSRSKMETVLQTQEGHIQTLHDRLEGSVTARYKLDSSINEKESMINELQTKVLQLEEATTETKRLNELVRLKDETIKRFEERVSEVELVLSRANSSCRDKDDMIESLQRRIEECVGQNKKLDVKLKKKEENLLKTQDDLLKMEKRDEIPAQLLEGVMTLSPSSSLKQKLWDAEARVEEADAAKEKLKHQMKRKETRIQELEKQLEESGDALQENDRLKKSIDHKEERTRILQLSVEQNQNEINSLESRLESSTSEIYKLRKSDDDKRKRINSFKMKLEDSNGILHQTLGKKEESIKGLEERNGELQRETIRLNERIISLESELENVRGRKGAAETIIVNTSPSRRKDISFVTSGNQKDIDVLNEKIGDLEKEIENLNLEKESEAIGFALLRGEKESLVRELETLRSDYDQLINDLADLKDSYTELDLSSAKSLHRCEMLTQMNSTLEEENKMLMEQMNKLLTQNQELLMESLVSRDQFMEEERTFSDRLYELQRQKEKLEEKIEQANRSRAENTPKKKSNLFKKVLQKAGLKKKKDEIPNNKTAVQLLKYGHNPGEPELGLSDVSAESAGTGFPDVYPLSPERASNSSNFSGSANSDKSPERDLSPLFRRRPKISRAQRSRVARSEYNSPALVNALAAHGRSRSLDTKEFALEVLQARGSVPEEESPALVSTTFTAVNHDDTTPSNVDGSRQVTRTQSFNLGGEARQPNNPIHSRKKSVENKPEVSKPVVNNNAELATTIDKASASPKLTGHITSINVRTSSDASRKSSDMSSSRSRSSSQCSADASSDTSKTTVRHIGSTSSSSGLAPTVAPETKIAKTGFINSEVNDSGRENNGKDELRLSSGSGDSTGNEKQTRVCRHKTPSPPPRMSVAVDRTDNKQPPSYPPVKNTEIFEDKPPTKRSNSFTERSHSPASVTRSHVQRQNSDRVLTSLHEVDRRSLVYSNSIPTNATRDNLLGLSSADQRLSSSGTQAGNATAQSIGIVSFKEVPRVQSAVLESSPLLEKKKLADVELKTSGHSSVEKNALKEVLSSSPVSHESETATGLRRTSKLENLLFEGATPSPKKERIAKTSPLWFEYGEV